MQEINVQVMVVIAGERDNRSVGGKEGEEKEENRSLTFKTVKRLLKPALNSSVLILPSCNDDRDILSISSNSTTNTALNTTPTTITSTRLASSSGVFRGVQGCTGVYPVHVEVVE